MAEMILVRGAPGSGKNTIASMLEWYESAKVFSTDDYFGVGKDYDFDGSKIREAHQSTIAKVDEEMMYYNTDDGFTDGISNVIIVANTFVKQWELQPYYDLVKKWNKQGSDWRVHTVIVENRHQSKSIHNVPKDKVLEMINNFEVLL